MTRKSPEHRLLVAFATTLVFLAALGAAGRPAGAEPMDPDSAGSAARRLSDAGHYNAALALLDETLSTHPDDVDLLWLRAGVTGWSGRNAEAVRLYEDLITRHPEMADALRIDLAGQRIQAGHPARALADIDAHLVEHPGDLDASRQRALALTYLERYDQAEAAYRDLLATHPTDLESRLGLARAANWRGDHRRAAGLYEDIVASGVDDAEVWNGLAYARYWSGRSDLARTPLDRSLRLDPRDRSPNELADQLSWEQRPWLSADYEISDDSDDLKVGTGVLGYHQPVGPRDAITASWRRQDTGGPPRDFDLAAVGLGHERVWSEAWTSQISLEYQYDGAGSTEYLLGEANVVHRPTDRVRIDAGVAREQMVAGRALDLDILAWTVTLGADWSVAPRWLLHAAFRHHEYSDDNNAFRSSFLARWKAVNGPRLEAALNLHVEQLAAADSPDHGYYAPEGYFEAAPGLELTYTATSGWLLGTEARLGLQKENGSPAEVLAGLSGRVETPLSPSIGFGVRLELSDSNLSAASGYSRNAMGAYLRGRF